MRKQKTHILTIAAGLLLAVAIVCSNVLLLAPKVHSVADCKSEKAKDEQEKFVFTAAPTITPPSSFLVQLNVEACCLFEVITQALKPEAFVSDFAIHPRKYLLTLFRVIISPNAP
jgi:hypothetical protein